MESRESRRRSIVSLVDEEGRFHHRKASAFELEDGEGKEGVASFVSFRANEQSFRL